MAHTGKRLLPVALVQEVLREVAALFPDEYFGVGGDEAAGQPTSPTSCTRPPPSLCDYSCTYRVHAHRSCGCQIRRIVLVLPSCIR
jgi:N-acetyl-beta-hexosaminidase